MSVALSGPSVFALVSGVNGCSLWRVLQPFQALQARQYPAYWDFIGDDHNEQRAGLGLPPVPNRIGEAMFTTLMSVTPCDVVLVPRLGWSPRVTGPSGKNALEEGLDMLARFRAAGKTLIYEADDDIFSPWIVQQQHRGLLPDSALDELEEDRHARVTVLQACDGATVTSQRLATVVRQFVPNDYPIAVVPNAIDWDFWRRCRHEYPRVVPPLTIGWVGGGRPDDDLAAMGWAWGQVAQKYPQIKFVVGGCRPGPDGRPSLDATAWTKPIRDYLPRQRIAVLGWLDVTRYPALYRNIDIGCCPLVDRPFNRTKSPIKAFEHAAAGAAVVASPTVYRQVIDSGEDGFLCTDKYEWAEALKELVANASRRRRMARALRRKVADEYSLERNLWRWPEAWADIVASSHARSQPLALAS